MTNADADLIGSVILAIDRAWQDGQVKYPDNPWREKLQEEHLDHVIDHLTFFDVGLGDAGRRVAKSPGSGDPARGLTLEDIDHAIFRLAALRWQVVNKK